MRQERRYVVGAIDTDDGYIYGSVGYQHILATTLDGAVKRADELWPKKSPDDNIIYELVPVDATGVRLT